MAKEKAKASQNPLQQTPTTRIRSAARLPHFFNSWKKVTSNKFILRIVKEGYKLQFTSFPTQSSYSPRNFSSGSLAITKAKVKEMLKEGAIVVVKPSPDQFVSHIFPVAKRTLGEFRIIFDLSELNKFIQKLSFKMGSYHSIMSLIARGDFFISIDLSDAYHAFAIHPFFQRFLTFIFLNIYYQYTCLPQGLTSAPRIFTKVVKTILVYFRSFAIKIAAWLDDFLLAASSAELVKSQADFAICTFQELGFIPNLEKSELTPVQKINHVGLVWDSVSYSVSIPEGKILDIQAKCRTALSSRVSIRFLKSILGSLKFFRWGCPIATLHYRALQRSVNFFLARGLSYDSKISLSEEARDDLDWWTSCSLSLPSRTLSPFSADLVLTSDASGGGWGAWTSSSSVFGKWSLSEAKLHINILELKSVLLSFQSLFSTTFSCSILVKSDNTTAIAYINKQGGTSCKILCDLALSLWQFCVVRNISLQAMYIEGILNTRADKLSRLKIVDHDYYLSQFKFSSMSDILPFPLVNDLFASRLTFKIKNYVSWKNDPHSSLVNAFSFKWVKNVYLFPPIPLIDRVLDKFIDDDVINGIIICPYWPSQTWFSRLLELLIDFPIFFSEGSIKDPSQILPKNCHFLGWPIGSDHARKLAFRAQLQDVPSGVSPKIPWLDTKKAGAGSVVGVVRGKLVKIRFV